MCYNTKQTRKVKDLENYYRVGLIQDRDYEIDDVAIRQAFDTPFYNLSGFMHPMMLIITSDLPDSLLPAKWGIAPDNFNVEYLDKFYELKKGAALNAQSEKAFKLALYYESIYERRCIVPVDGFYEPHTLPIDKKIPKTVPFHFEYEDKSPISFAGIYNILRNQESKKEYFVFTILTKKATPLFKEIHNSPAKDNGHRMPLILDEKYLDDWLDVDISTGYLTDIMESNTEKEIVARPIKRDIYRRNLDSNYEGVDDFHNYHQDPQGLKFDFKGYKPHFFGEGQTSLFD